MPKLIKHDSVIEDDWKLIDSLDAEATLPDGKAILPWRAIQTRQQELLQREHLGVWLDSDEEPAGLEAILDKAAVIAINFPAFTDGRGYSYAQILRQRFDYGGELRAIGDVLRDQLFLMKRCGFDAFALRADLDPQACLSAFDDFSESYQAAADQPVPLFRRRGSSQ